MPTDYEEDSLDPIVTQGSEAGPPADDYAALPRQRRAARGDLKLRRLVSLFSSAAFVLLLGAAVLASWLLGPFPPASALVGALLVLSITGRWIGTAGQRPAARMLHVALDAALGLWALSVMERWILASGLLVAAIVLILVIQTIAGRRTSAGR